MIKVFIPEIKRKYGKKDLARGFWKNDSGRVYYDYIKIKNFNLNIEAGHYEKELFYNYLDTLKNTLKQEAIFYIEAGQGFIYSGRDNVIILKNRIFKEVNRDNLKHSIKEALSTYSGCTIYNEAGKYFIEIFY